MLLVFFPPPVLHPPPYSNPFAPAGGIARRRCCQPALGQEPRLDGQVDADAVARGIDVEAGADQERLADPGDAEVLRRCCPGCPGRSTCRTTRPTSGSSNSVYENERIWLWIGPSRMRKPTYRLPRGGRVRKPPTRDDLLPWSKKSKMPSLTSVSRSPTCQRKS